VSNYLVNLAARTMNLAEPVSPRLRGRFEPAPDLAPGRPVSGEASGETWAERLDEPQPNDSVAFAPAISAQRELPVELRARERQPARDYEKRIQRHERISLEPTTNEASRASVVATDLETGLPPDQPNPVRAPIEKTSLHGSADSRTERVQPYRPPREPQSANPVDTRSINESERARLNPAEKLTQAIEPVSGAGLSGFRDRPFGEAAAARLFDATLASDPPPTTQQPKEALRRDRSRDSAPREEPTTDDFAQPDAIVKSPLSTLQPSKPADVRPSSIVIARPAIAPLLDGRRSTVALDQSTSAPEPTVHVTIGRIEVRAVQATPSPSTRSRATTPVMNLDDYLRRRSGGRAG
jgi:hypothetical protein